MKTRLRVPASTCLLLVSMASSTACVDDPTALESADTETTATASESESESEGESEGMLPDLGSAPDENCPNPGPWPLPVPPELELPHFVTTSYIDLDQIGWLTKFRSSVGHDYSDEFEHCRSMKHYAYPLDEVDWAAIEIRSPVAGEVIAVEEEMFGTRVQVRSDAHPEFDFLIFHVALASPLAEGASLTEGELLGTHYGIETYSDIAVATEVDGQLRLVSWFDVISDELLAEFQARGGIASREAAIITQAERDADALCCTDGQFDAEENLDDWLALDGTPLAPPVLGLAAPAHEPGELGFRR